MNWLILLAALLAVPVAIGLRFRRRLAALAQAQRSVPAVRTVVRSAAASARPHQRRHYYGAALKTGPGSCDSARAIEARRYLAQDAPSLPLSGCDAVTCNCRIVPLDDRRAGYDRRNRFVAYGDFDAEFNREQRTNEERRKPL